MYNAAYLARVHRRLPGARRRPFMVFLHGIEIWENAKPGSVAACRRADLLVANSSYTRARAEKCHVRVAGQGHGNHYTLPHTARKLMRII